MGLLDKKKAVKEVESTFHHQVEIMQGLVDYGASLISSAIDASPKEFEDVLVVGVFLKQLVQMFDSFEVLIASGCGQTSELQLRAMFESAVYIDFILKSGGRNKSQHYYVANLRQELLWCNRSSKGTEEQEKFKSSLVGLENMFTKTSNKISEYSKQRADEIEEYLQTSEFSVINKKFVKIKNKKGYEATWHSILGFGSFRMIAKHVGRSAEYQMVYNIASEKIHSSRYKSHVQFKNGNVLVDNIRHAEGIKASIQSAMTIAINCYGVIIGKYLPDEEANFNTLYLRDWRQGYQSIPSIIYDR